MQSRYLDRREAAQYLTVTRGLSTSWRTLQKMATVGELWGILGDAA